MSRQQKRAEERKRRKAALQKICLAAGEGVGQAVVFSFALAGNAFAAEPKKEETFNLPPVVVQEQNSPYVVPESSLSKFPVPLKDTPQSITIVPQKVIEEQGGSTLRDALRNVPGIGINAGEGGGAQGDGFTLRGFNARNDMYIDGVRDSGSYFRDAFNIESVEVLKGPSSTYFGRGSTGGIINQSSKMPSLLPSYGGMFSGGSDFYFRGTVDVNQPLPAISPNAAMRLNLMAHRNDVAGRDEVKNRRLGFAPSIAFGLGTPTQLTLSYLTQYENNIPDYGMPFFHGSIVRVDRKTWYGLAKEDFEKTWANVATAKLEHRFNDQLNVRNTLRFSHVDREAVPSIPQLVCLAPADCGPGATITGVNRSRPERDTQESILSNQTDLTAKFDTWNFRHTLTTGVEVSREAFDILRYASSGPVTLLVNPDNHQLPAAKTVNVKTATNAVGFGIFAVDQIKLNEYFDIIGGLRRDYFKTKFDNKLGSPDFDREDKMMSYRGGLVFYPTQRQSYYFSYGSSFNPSAEALSLNAANKATPPEKNQIFEIGGKVELMDGALNITGALFRIEKTDARTDDPVTGTVDVLDGKQRSQGFEIGVAGQVLPGLNVFAGYTFLDAKITRSNDVQTVEGVTYPIEGKVPQNVPKHSATLWATYDFLEKWQIGGGPTYVGERFANNSNSRRVDGYVRWDSTVAYQLTRNISLRFNAQNLTNKFYIESVHPSHIVPGAGRTFILGAGFKF